MKYYVFYIFCFTYTIQNKLLTFNILINSPLMCVVLLYNFDNITFMIGNNNIMCYFDNQKLYRYYMVIDDIMSISYTHPQPH